MNVQEHMLEHREELSKLYMLGLLDRNIFRYFEIEQYVIDLRVTGVSIPKSYKVAAERFKMSERNILRVHKKMNQDILDTSMSNY